MYHGPRHPLTIGVQREKQSEKPPRGGDDEAEGVQRPLYMSSLLIQRV